MCDCFKLNLGSFCHFDDERRGWSGREPRTRHGADQLEEFAGRPTAASAGANAALREVALMAVATFRPPGDPKLTLDATIPATSRSWLEIATVPKVS